MKPNLKRFFIAGLLSASSLLTQSISGENPNEFVKNNDFVSSELSHYSTTTHHIYEIQKESKNNFHEVSNLERLINKIETKFNKKDKYTQKEVLDILKETNKEIENLIPEIKKIENNCDDYSCIYIAIGEKLNIPLYGVFAPNHIFIRYDPDGKHDALNPNNPVNKEDFNWETLYGVVLSDKFYTSGFFIENKMGIPKNLIEKGVYMKNLTKKELLSIPYFNLALNYYNLEKNELAIENFNKVLELNPKYIDAYYGRGDSFLRKGENTLALEDYEKILELDPDNDYIINRIEMAKKAIENPKNIRH